MRHTMQGLTPPRYPDAKPELPARSRGVIALVEENCTACMLCARECPDWCIYIDSHKETLPAPEGGRPRARNVLDRFAIDFSLCMYCGICVEVCPFDALYWSPEFEYAAFDIHDLLHEKDRLAGWFPTVPPPPAVDSGAAGPAGSQAVPGSSAAQSRPGPEGAPAAASGRPAAGEPARPGGRVAVPDDSGERAGAHGSPESAEPRERRDARDRLADVRSVRPPGASPATPGAPAGPAASPAGTSPGGRAADPSASQERSQERPGRMSARERLANVRSIRPPGALPGRPGGPGAQGGRGEEPAGADASVSQGDAAAAGPSASRDRSGGRPGRASARELLANVRSIRPPGALPRKPDAPGTPTRPETGEADVRPTSPRGTGPASASAHQSAEASAEREPGRPGERGTQRSARELLANVRSIRPPGAPPKKTGDS